MSAAAWRSRLAQSMGGSQDALMHLATVSSAGRPEVRTVGLAGFLGQSDSRLPFTSHRRKGKLQNLVGQPWAEVGAHGDGPAACPARALREALQTCLWFPGSGEQWRLAGNLTVCDSEGAPTDAAMAQALAKVCPPPGDPPLRSAVRPPLQLQPCAAAAPGPVGAAERPVEGLAPGPRPRRPRRGRAGGAARQCVRHGRGPARLRPGSRPCHALLCCPRQRATRSWPPQMCMDAERVEYVKLGSCQAEDRRLLYERQPASDHWHELRLSP